MHPVRELNELCQRENYVRKKTKVDRTNEKATITVEVEANGVVHKHSSSVTDKKTAKRLASKAVLKSIKESMSSNSNTRRRSLI